MSFIKTMLFVIIYMTHSQIEIESVKLTKLIEDLPNSVDYNDFIPTIGKACILHNLYNILNIILDVPHDFNTTVNYTEIQERGNEFQRVLVELLKFLDTLTIQIYGNFLLELFYVIKDNLNDGSLHNGNRLKEKLNDIIELPIWDQKIDDWNKEENKDNLIVVCNHIQSIFTDNEEYVTYMVDVLNNHLPNINFEIKIYQLSSNIVGNEAITMITSLLAQPTHLAIRLLLGHYENLMCIYSDLIQTINEVRSINDCGLYQKDYLIIIFKEFLEIYIFAERIFNNIKKYNISITYFHKMVEYHIYFRDYFKKFVYEYRLTRNNELDDNSIITMTEIFNQYNPMPFHLKYLLIDTHYHDWSTSTNIPILNLLCRNCKPYEWISIDYDTLQYKFLNYSETAFTFIDKINRLQQRRLASEFTVSFIIEFITDNPTIFNPSPDNQ